MEKRNAGAVMGGSFDLEKKESSAGNCARQTLPQNHSLEKQEQLIITRFYKPGSPKSEASEVH